MTMSQVIQIGVVSANMKTENHPFLSNYSNQIWPLAEPATALGGPALHPSASVAFGWAAAHHPLWPEKWQNHQPHRYLGTSWYIPHSNASPFHIYSQVNPPVFQWTQQLHRSASPLRSWLWRSRGPEPGAQKVRGFPQSFPSWEVVMVAVCSPD